MDSSRNDFGLDVGIDTDPATCVLCRRRQNVRPILLPEDVSVFSSENVLCGVCEPCALLAAWRWRSISDAVATPPFPTSPSVVMVMLVRERQVTALTTTTVRGDDGTYVPTESKTQIPDPVIPHDVLMVTRKEEPDAFALPGGKVELGEDPVAAAIRELAEETGIHTWPFALEPLHDGFTARGRLARVYLCRVYAGEPATMEPGVNVEWKPGMPGDHSGAYRGFYSGIELAFGMRLRIQKLSDVRVFLCTKFGKAGRQYLDLVVNSGPARTSDDVQLASGFRYVMTEQEKMTVEALFRFSPEKKEPAPAAPADEAAQSVDGTGEDEVPTNMEDIE